MPKRWQSAVATFAHRALALGCALVVIALAIFAASPELHHKLHMGDSDAGADSCAVVLFAAGVSAAVAAIAVAAPTLAFAEAERVIPVRVYVASPRYLRQPERGPPVLS
jgi:hypothetical protein